MSRTPAKHTQADINRSVRAVKQAGGGLIELRPDGIILISINSLEDNKKALAEPEDVVL